MKAHHSSNTKKVAVYSALFCLFSWAHPAFGAAEGVTITSDVHLSKTTVGESAVVRVGAVNIEGSTINGNMAITSKAIVGEISADSSAQVNVASAHFHQAKVQGNAKIELAARTGNITAGQGSTVSVGGFEIDKQKQINPVVTDNLGVSEGLLSSTNHCGPSSNRLLNFIVPEYLCFSSWGATLPSATCALGGIAGLTPVYLGEACREHDKCYGTKGSNKSDCDNNFRSLMVETCDTNLAGYQNIIKRELCYNAVAEYHYQVYDRGCSAYTNAQNQLGNENPVCI